MLQIGYTMGLEFMEIDTLVAAVQATGSKKKLILIIKGLAHQLIVSTRKSRNFLVLPVNMPK